MGFWSLSLLVVLSVAFAQSQPPSTTPSGVTQTKQNKAPAKSNVPVPDKASPQPPSQFPQTPLTVKKQDAPPDAQDKKGKGDEKQRSMSPDFKFLGAGITDWLLAIFTFCLVIVGGIQVFVYCRQANYMRRGLRISIRQTRAASINARAAKASADTAKDTLVISQRASIAIHPISFAPPLSQSANAIAACIEFKIENTGQTVARACYFHVQVLADSPEQQIVKPTPLVSAKTDLGPRFPIGQITSPITELFNGSVSAGILQAAMQRGAFRVVGFVRYKDIFDNGMYLAFRAVLNWQTMKFDTSTQLRPDGEQPDPDEDKLYG